MDNRILIIFEETQKYKKNQISEFVNLTRRDCVIVTLEDLSKNNILKEFSSVIDCTFDNKIFNKNLTRGQALKSDGIEYLLITENKKIVCKGPNISQLTLSNSDNQAIQEKFKESYEKYQKTIDFLANKNIYIRNSNSFNEGSKNGIVLNHVIKNNQQKIYKLVYSLPEIKEENTEYVLFDDIEILKDLKELVEGMVFI